MTLEKRLFSILWAIESFNASGRVLSRIFLCWKKKALSVLKNSLTDREWKKPAYVHNPSRTGIAPTALHCTWYWHLIWKNHFSCTLLFSAQFVDYTIWSECCLLRSCHGNPKIHLPSPSAALPSVPTTLLQLPALGAKPRNQDSNILFLVSLTLDERPGMIQEFYPSPWI